MASPDRAQDSVTVHADAALQAGLFNGSETAELAVNPIRKGYLHLVRGDVEVNGQRIDSGHAALLEGESRIVLANGTEREIRSESRGVALLDAMTSTAASIAFNDCNEGPALTVMQSYA